jgi:hypothetical protein
MSSLKTYLKLTKNTELSCRADASVRYRVFGEGVDIVFAVHNARRGLHLNNFVLAD